MLSLKEHKKKFFNDFFKQISSLGSYQAYISYSVLILLTGFINEFVFLIIGLILMYIIAIPIRYFYVKDRPKAKPRNNLIEKISASSFPSLHSTRTIFLLLFLINFFEKEFAISLFLCLIALLILYSRIYRKKHDVADIIGGIVLGIGLFYIARLVF